MKPLVSVIVPTFNRGQYLIEALDSVIGQTHRPLEVVVVDDGSDKDDLGLARSWWDDLPEARREGCRLVLSRQKNGGPSKARNRGLAEATGEFIQFLDSDDLLHPDKIECQLDAFSARPTLGYVYSSLRAGRIERGEMVGRAQVRVGPDSFNVGRHISLRDSLQTSVGLYRREICDRLGPWNESLTVGEDIEYNLRLILRRVPAVYVEGCFVSLRSHGGPRASRKSGPETLLRTFRALEFELSEHGSPSERHAARSWFAYAYCRVGFEAVIARQQAVARDCLRLAWAYASTAAERFKVACLWPLVRLPLPSRLRTGLARTALGLAPYRRLLRRFSPQPDKSPA